MIMPAAAATRILIVDNEAATRRMLTMGLGAADYTVNDADRGMMALEAVRRREVDLLLLDLALPDIDGLQIIKRIRYAGSDVPIIVLSNRHEESAKVAALDLGADDYLTKPFSIEELLARIRVLQRHRVQLPGERSIIEVGDLRLNVAIRTAVVRGTEIRLSPREYELLELLATHPGRVLSHRFILRRVWGNESDVQYLRIYIRSLRQKIETDPAKPTRIVTMQGVGYYLRVGSQAGSRDSSSRSDIELIAAESADSL